MAAFYHDNTRRRQFAERVGQNGPVSGPERCLIDLLEWSPGNDLFYWLRKNTPRFSALTRFQGILVSKLV